ncbi:uncharacterized protein LOC143252651 isoform X1 [Tachypleus tridentatus]|uniref:uncharacterized protein LOC143252651 isoform X1 n=1 Tax=Tachypleus tridentatus TaxID=6853 RepID=UPI003FD30EF2
MLCISATCSEPARELMTYCDDSCKTYCRMKGTSHPLQTSTLLDSNCKCLHDVRILLQRFYHQICIMLNGQKCLKKSRCRISSSWCSYLLTVVVIVSLLTRIAEACSSRSTPKPRTTMPTTSRPNITFQTYACPEAYAKWYCLNGATCFSVKIGESILYNCECADGYMGQRCEFKDLDGSYAIKDRDITSKTASIAGGLALAIVTVIICIVCCMCLRRRQKRKMMEKYVLRSLVIPVLHQTLPQRSISENVDLKNPNYVHPPCTLLPLATEQQSASKDNGFSN